MITWVNCYKSYKHAMFIEIIRPDLPTLMEMKEMRSNIWHDLRVLEEKFLINSEQCDKVASWEKKGMKISSNWLIPV